MNSREETTLKWLMDDESWRSGRRSRLHGAAAPTTCPGTFRRCPFVWPPTE